MLVQPYGVTPIKYLQQWNVFDRDFSAVHCVNLTRDDISTLRDADVAVVHCPKSNAKLGCGVAPLADLLRAGVRVGLGTDSPGLEHIMDMFDEMRTMLLLHRAVERGRRVLDGRRCVRIAHAGRRPRRSAWTHEVGSLEVGKYADLNRRRRLALALRADLRPVLALVYGANQDDIMVTVIGGRQLYRDRAPRERRRRRRPCQGRWPCARSCRPRAQRETSRSAPRAPAGGRPRRPSSRGDSLSAARSCKVKFWQKRLRIHGVIMAAFLVFRLLGCAQRLATS
jgi:cytosine/adenosine deaminase-related metal-dependent hydrolase